MGFVEAEEELWHAEDDTVETAPPGSKLDAAPFDVCESILCPSSLLAVIVGVTSKKREIHALLKLTPALTKKI